MRDFDALKILVSFGTKISVLNKNNRSPLYNSAVKNKYDNFEFL